MSKDLTRVEEILASYDYEPHHLIAIMQDIQSEYKYLSQDMLCLIAQKLGLSIAKVYSVATFYENFSLEAKGKYIIRVCDGTACHVRKSGPIYDAIRKELGLIGKQKTSADGMFTLETVACLGACGGNDRQRRGPCSDDAGVRSGTAGRAAEGGCCKCLS